MRSPTRSSLERFATWGISGGGPHALACAALCDDRLTAVASLAGVAPWGADGLDWLAGMGEDNIEEFDNVLAGEEALRPARRAGPSEMLKAEPEELRRCSTRCSARPTARSSPARFAEYMLECDHHGLEHGADGWIDDDLAFVGTVGLRPRATSTARCCSSTAATTASCRVSHGEWLAAHIPGAEAWIDDADGHLTLLERRCARSTTGCCRTAERRRSTRRSARGSSPPPTARACSGLVRRHGMRLGAARFVAGETLDECVAVLRALNDQGLVREHDAARRRRARADADRGASSRRTAR